MFFHIVYSYFFDSRIRIKYPIFISPFLASQLTVRRRQSQRASAICSRSSSAGMAVPGVPGVLVTPPIFGRSVNTISAKGADYALYYWAPQIVWPSAVPIMPPMLSSDGGGSSVQCETVSATIFLSWRDKRSKLCTYCSSFGRENCWDLIHISLYLSVSVCILKSSSVLFIFS